jgi:hypothetical protein
VTLAARWLAALHRLRLTGGSIVDTITHERVRFDSYERSFSETGSPFLSAARELIAFAREGEERLFTENREPFIRVHGDYHPRNIIIGQDKSQDPKTLYISVIDFNNSLLFSPAFDVGYFLAQFRAQLNGLPDILERFQARHPLLRLMLKELSSSEQLIELAHDRLDIGFVHTTRVPPELSQILVSSQAFVGCLPAGHALAQQKSLSLGDLQGEPFAVVSRAVSPDYHERILSICIEAGFYPEIRYELRHWLSVVSLVSQGMGVALVPAALGRSAMAGAAFVPLDRATTPYDTHCLWKTARDNPALAAFVDAVRAANAR